MSESIYSRKEGVTATKRMITELMDKIPEDRLGYVLAYIQGIAVCEASENGIFSKEIKDYLKKPDETQSD